MRKAFEVFSVTVYGRLQGWYWQRVGPDGVRTGPPHGPFKTERAARSDEERHHD